MSPRAVLQKCFRNGNSFQTWFSHPCSRLINSLSPAHNLKPLPGSGGAALRPALAVLSADDVPAVPETQVLARLRASRWRSKELALPHSISLWLRSWHLQQLPPSPVTFLQLRPADRPALEHPRRAEESWHVLVSQGFLTRAASAGCVNLPGSRQSHAAHRGRPGLAGSLPPR